MKVRRQLIRRILCSLLAALFLMGCAKSTEQQISEQLELGQKYLAEAKYEEAIAAFQRVIELNPKNPQAYEFLGQAYADSGETELAIQILEKGMDVVEAALPQEYQSLLISLYTEQAKNALQNGDTDRAEDSYKKILELNPDNQDSRNRLDEILNITSVNVEKDSFAKSHPCEWFIQQIEQKGVTTSAYSYADFDGDGTHELFAEVKQGNTRIFYFCNSDASICEEIYSIELQESCRSRGFEKLKVENNAYLCWRYGDGDNIMTYCITGVLDGKPQVVKAGNVNIPEAQFTQTMETLLGGGQS